MRFMTDEVIVKRNQTVLGPLNRPITELIEIGRYKCSLDKGTGSTVTQTDPQAVVRNLFSLYVEPQADIKRNDVLYINGEKYFATDPAVRHRTHIELEIITNAEA